MLQSLYNYIQHGALGLGVLFLLAGTTAQFFMSIIDTFFTEKKITFEFEIKQES